MPDDFSTIFIERPMPPGSRLAVALPLGLSLRWAIRGLPVWAAVGLLLVPVLLAVGDRFELDGAVGDVYWSGFSAGGGRQV